MWPEILEAVIGRRLSGRSAALSGYSRRCIKGVCYPGILPMENGEVPGVLYEGLTAVEFERLDRFEGEEYDRRTVCINGGAAEVYVLGDSWRHLAEERAWEPEHLPPEQLSDFCEEYRGWHALDRDGAKEH